MTGNKLKELFGIHAAEAPRGKVTDSRNWIDPEEIKPHKYGSSFIPEKLSSDPEKARKKIEGLKAIHEKELARDIQIYNEYRQQGQDRSSDYDKNICYGSASKALHGALDLKSNHITYHVSHIAEFNDYLNGQLDGHTVQMGLF